MVLAHYDSDFQPLSTRHENLIRKADELLDAYRHEQLQHPTYAVVGTFGAGKTQFLYYLTRKAIERGLLPLLFLAEDLFSEIVRVNKVFTQGDVAVLVENKIKEAIAALSVESTSNDVRESLSAILDPRGNNSHFVDELVTKFAGKPIQHPVWFFLLTSWKVSIGLYRRGCRHRGTEARSVSYSRLASFFRCRT